MTRLLGLPQVLKYLARYTHRVAISNARILDFEDGMVRFRYKDYAHGNRKRVMTLTALEFVRRLLLHVLPTGFVRIRHYGILSNRNRRQKLVLCRRLLESSKAAEPEPESPEETKETRDSPSSVTPDPGVPGLWRGAAGRDPGIPADASRTGGSHRGWVVCRLRQFVTESEGRSHPWVPQTTVARDGAESPCAEAEKPAKFATIGVSRVIVEQALGG